MNRLVGRIPYPVRRPGGFPVKGKRMTGLRFYWACLRHASKQSWSLIGILSTIATFAPSIAAKMFGFADPAFVDKALLISPLIVLIVCFIVVPFREAFRLYQEKDKQLEAEKARREEEKRQWDEERAALQQKLQAPNPFENAQRAAVREALSKLDELERQAMLHILIFNGQTDYQIREKLPKGTTWAGEIGAALSDKTQLLYRDFQGTWRIKKDLKQYVEEMLG
jgi:hypothetical protein